MKQMATPGSTLTKDQLTAYVAAIDSYIKLTADYYNGHAPWKGFPAGSQAEVESASYQDPNQILNAVSVGNLLMESAMDHLMAFVDIVKEPSKTIAPATCIRGCLEACAIAVWLLDPKISSQERAGRQYSFRHEGFSQQRKLASTEGERAIEEACQRKVEDLDRKAQALGFAQLLDRSNHITGVGVVWPGITSLMQSQLNMNFAYRVLSAVAHAHPWALPQIGFKPSDDQSTAGPAAIHLEKHVHPEGVWILGHWGVIGTSRAYWCFGRLFGWDETEQGKLLSAAYDDLRFNKATRFW